MADAAEEGTIRFSEHTKFVTGLWSSRLVDNTFANVRIIPSDTKVTMFAHSSALALASPFLRHLLVAVDPDEDGIYQIFLPDLDIASVKALLKLIYTGSTVGDLDREVQEMGKVIGLAIDAEEMGASKSPESPEASTVPSPMRDDDSANEEEEEITEESEMKDDFALTVKLEENLSKAKFQDSKKRRRKSSTSAAVIASAAAVSSANAAEKPPPKGKRVLMADLDRSQLTCDVCGKEFQVMYKLKLHKLIHSSSPPFVCSLCGKGFNNKYKMRVHEKHHANLVNASGKAGVAKDKAESNDDVYPGVSKRKAGSNACKFCSAPEFKTKSALNAHLGAAHPNFRRFLCSMCGKGFKGQKGLGKYIPWYLSMSSYSTVYLVITSVRTATECLRRSDLGNLHVTFPSSFFHDSFIRSPHQLCLRARRRRKSVPLPRVPRQARQPTRREEAHGYARAATGVEVPQLPDRLEVS